MPDASSVPALIPLSLLEAIRNLDTPVEDGMPEMADDIVARRLGLSTTVAAQIERYKGAADRAGNVTAEEVISVLRLVGRRPDAPLVFADAGRRAARYAARARARATQTPAPLAPGSVAERMAARATRKVAAGVFGADLHARGAAPEARMQHALSVVAVPDGGACAFYGTAFAELLRFLLAYEGMMVHERCESRGDDMCVWRGVVGEYE